MTREALLAAMGDEERLRKAEVAILLTKYGRAVINDIETFRAALTSAGSVGARILEAVNKADLDAYESEILALHDLGVHCLSILDPEFPQRLRGLPDPPLSLYIRGSLPLGQCAAVVGTREISPEGTEATADVVRALACERIGVVSGLARGTDTVAHEAALSVGTPTFAVLPGGPKDIIPRENAGLADRVAESGGIICEVTDLRPVHKGRFIQRNRITSAVADFVVAMESGIEGGTTHQVKFALEQRRPVFVWGGTAIKAHRAGHDLFVEWGARSFQNSTELLSLMKTPSEPSRAPQMRLDSF